MSALGSLDYLADGGLATLAPATHLATELRQLETTIALSLANRDAVSRSNDPERARRRLSVVLCAELHAEVPPS